MFFALLLEIIVVPHINFFARQPAGGWGVTNYLYLATSDEEQGLVAQGRTVTETLEIARDLAKKLIEAQSSISLPEVADNFSYPLVIG